jgi:hypothetical protein
MKKMSVTTVPCSMAYEESELLNDHVFHLLASLVLSESSWTR